MQTVNLRQLASNFSFLAGGEVISKICTFVAFTFLARILGPIEFGYLEFSLAVMVLFTLFVDFGTSPYGAREIAKNNLNTDELVSQIVTLRIFLAIVGYLILLVFAFLLLNKKIPIRNLLIIYGLALFGIPVFLQWVFQGFEKMKYVALGSILRQLIFAVCVLLFIRHPVDIWAAPWIECFSVMIFALYCLYVLQTRIKKIRFRIKKGTLKSCFMQAMPIGISEMAFAATFYSATLTLGYLVGGKSVGWFGAAHRIIMAIHTFVWLYFYNMLPSISRCDGQPKEVLQELLRKSIIITSWASIFIGLSGTILAEPIITIVYGSGYSEAAKTLKILVWVVAIMFLNGHFTYTLIAYNFQRLLLICYGISTITCVLMCLLLIEKYQQLGSAVALLSATVVNGGLAYSFVFQNIGRISILHFLIKPVLSGIATFSILLFLSPSNLLLSCALLLGLYFSSFLALEPKLFNNFLLLVTKNR